MLVFALYKKEAARLEEFLRRRGWKVGAIHGDKGQADRTRALERYLGDGLLPVHKKLHSAANTYFSPFLF